MEHNKQVHLCSIGFPFVVAAMNRVIHESYDYYYAGKPKSSLATAAKVAGAGALGLGGAALANPTAVSQGIKTVGGAITDFGGKVPEMVQNARHFVFGDESNDSSGNNTKSASTNNAAPAEQKTPPSTTPPNNGEAAAKAVNPTNQQVALNQTTQQQSAQQTQPKPPPQPAQQPVKNTPSTSSQTQVQSGQQSVPSASMINAHMKNMDSALGKTPFFDRGNVGQNIPEPSQLQNTASNPVPKTITQTTSQTTSNPTPKRMSAVNPKNFQDAWEKEGNPSNSFAKINNRPIAMRNSNTGFA